MKTTKIYQIDAFTRELFKGNPAAVCLLDKWPADELMQHIAAENNLAETAFIVPEQKEYGIRWFTPTVEVDLCGHATLASAHVLFNHEGVSGNEIVFNSPRSGTLKVKREGELLTLDFPADSIEPVDKAEEIARAIGAKPVETLKGKTDYVAVLASEEEVKKLKPDFALVSRLKARGLIVTAKGTGVDFVSRFFAPQSGIDEDPVTGSAHTTLAPYWSQQLNKPGLSARQISPRGGELKCTVAGNRVEISGYAKTYLAGTILL